MWIWLGEEGLVGVSCAWSLLATTFDQGKRAATNAPANRDEKQDEEKRLGHLGTWLGTGTLTGTSLERKGNYWVEGLDATISAPVAPLP